jgi:hypothetical protein
MTNDQEQTPVAREADEPVDIDPKEWIESHPLSAALMGAAAGFAAGSGLGSKAVDLVKMAARSEQAKRIAASAYPIAKKAVISYLKQEVRGLVPIGRHKEEA